MPNQFSLNRIEEQSKDHATVCLPNNLRTYNIYCLVPLAEVAGAAIFKSRWSHVGKWENYVHMRYQRDLLWMAQLAPIWKVFLDLDKSWIGIYIVFRCDNMHAMYPNMQKEWFKTWTNGHNLSTVGEVRLHLGIFPMNLDLRQWVVSVYRCRRSCEIFWAKGEIHRKDT